MLSIKKVFVVGFAAFMLAASFSTSNAQAVPADGIEDIEVIEPGGGTKKIVATDCVDPKTGEVLAYSNDCGAGSSNCIDNKCP